MTLAICRKCGASKVGAITPCAECSYVPRSIDEVARSIVMSDNHFDSSTLQKFAECIRNGEEPPLNPALVHQYSEMISSPAGAAILGIHFEMYPEKLKRYDRLADIVSFLHTLERSCPGSVRLKANPIMTREILELLRSGGLSKGFFTSGEQFIYDSFLSHRVVMERLLPSCLLAGPTNGDGQVLCWGGRGAFAGTQGVFQLTDFTMSGKQRIPLIVNIDLFFDKIRNILETPP